MSKTTRERLTRLTNCRDFWAAKGVQEEAKAIQATIDRIVKNSERQTRR